MKDDKVYRELFVLKMQSIRLRKTLDELEKALRADERFNRLRLLRDTRQPALFEESGKGGPEAPSDPFEVPLGEPFD